MSRTTVSLSLTEPELAALRQVSGQQGLNPEVLCVRLALTYAAEHGFREQGPSQMWLRKSPFWGPPASDVGRTQSLDASVTETELQVLTDAAGYFKVQAPQGGFGALTVSQFVVGAAVRCVEKSASQGKPLEIVKGQTQAKPAPLPPKPLPTKTTAPAPSPRVTPAPTKSSLLGPEGKYVLIVAVGATALVLGAVILKKLDDRKNAAATPVLAATPQSVSEEPNEDDDVNRPSSERRRTPLYYGKSSAPSKDAAKNIDALLEQKYGRPSVPVDGQRGKTGEKPLWMGGGGEPGGYDALHRLVQALPPDQVYDVAIAKALADTATVYPVPSALVKGIIKRESGFNPKALSKTGAVGLMQVMPFNAKRVGLTEQELWEPNKNILAGVRLMAVLLKYYQGDVISALTAYNARPRELFAPVPRNGETPEYVAAVLRYYEEYHGSPLLQGTQAGGPGSARLTPAGKAGFASGGAQAP
jgi:hypothetical protein